MRSVRKKINANKCESNANDHEYLREFVLENNLLEIIKIALEEDKYFDDITTKSLNLGNLKLQAVIKAKEAGVCAGINVVRRIFKIIDKKIRFDSAKKDGWTFKKGDILIKMNGPVKSILAGERTALNFLSHLSGIATLTHKFVKEVKPYRVKILDTRKTTPGLRLFEKYAVRMGGGFNHRLDLADGVLVKDNHISALKFNSGKINLGLITEEIKAKIKNKTIEIEVNSISQFKEVLKYKPDIIMLDNMNTRQIKECVKVRNAFDKNIQLETSGNVNLGNIKIFAKLGVERISIGCLTHSAPAIDFSLDFITPAKISK